jgi:hypothetical protein
MTVTIPADRTAEEADSQAIPATRLEGSITKKGR